jgi:MFS family permease
MQGNDHSMPILMYLTYNRTTISLILGSLSFIVFYLLIPFDNSTIFSMVLSTCLMMIFGFIGSIFIAMRVGNVYAIYSECALPEDRGITNSLSGLMVQVGGIIGNIIVYFLVEDSLWLAMRVILVIGLLSSIQQALMYFTCSNDAVACEETMVKRSARLSRGPE